MRAEIMVAKTLNGVQNNVKVYFIIPGHMLFLTSPIFTTQHVVRSVEKGTPGVLHRGMPHMECPGARAPLYVVYAPPTCGARRASTGKRIGVHVFGVPVVIFYRPPAPTRSQPHPASARHRHAVPAPRPARGRVRACACARARAPHATACSRGPASPSQT